MKAPNVGKWGKHQHMVQDEFLREHLPRTRLFSPEALWEYAADYKRVMLKPSGGGGGAGIIQLTDLGDDRYLIHSGKHRRTVEGKEKAVQYAKSLFRPKTYLLQPRIPLGRINGKPFDVRVMIQRKGKHSPWVITGWVAKLAGPGFVVTNVARSRGKVLPLRTAIKQSNIAANPNLLGEIRQVSMAVANRLGTAYPTLREIGLDMGIDIHGKPWIIEANFRPSLSLFQQLQDQTFYRRILAMRKR
ncbi:MULTISPECIES: YheC/YheD family protein [Brevibacillus]|uniref:YheC/YheD family protein n=1 Tax=Brevibacillus TaxID=55080 RepID=UPI002380643B|nr:MULTISPECIES: YheC/YheD family protein [Brevibacillus]WDV98187.1 YheC/YheD family protein [Brevibacillus parabrevis]